MNPMMMELNEGRPFSSSTCLLFFSSSSSSSNFNGLHFSSPSSSLHLYRQFSPIANISPLNKLKNDLPSSLILPFRNSCGTKNRGMIKDNTLPVVLGSQLWNLNQKGRGNFGPLRNSILFRFPCSHFASSSTPHPSTRSSCIELPTAFAASDYSKDDIRFPEVVNDTHEMSLNQIDYLLQILHQSANTFFIAIQSHKSVRNCLELSKAWVGVDVHAWHKHVAYEAAVYALLKTVKEMGIAICDEHENDPHPFFRIISPKISILLEDIESQLNIRDPRLVEWFKMEQLPVFAEHFAPLLGRWSTEYPTSGVAVIVLAISCTIAVQKLGAERISCPLFTHSFPDMIGELMDVLLGLASMDKLHKLASKAGFEHEFLAHFCSNVLYHNRSCEVVFWVSMAWRKLILAIQREGVVSKLQILHDSKILERDLATLGLLAFLGRRTRLFLSSMGIKDLDEPLQDFLSYLECGSLFIYPELSSIPAYELFMEVVTEEIGWLDFYAAIAGVSYTDRRRSKQHAKQAEKEIILSTIFNVCSHALSSFDHFSKSTQQSLDANLAAILLQSQNLLNICLDDYWAAYDKLYDLPKIKEVRFPESKPSLEDQDKVNVSVSLNDVHKKFGDSMTRGNTECMHQQLLRVSKHSTSLNMMDSVTLEKLPDAIERKPTYQSLLRKSTNKLMSTSSDLWMGTRLLFIDISAALCILQKRISGHKLTKMEMKKLKRVLNDIISVVPVAILMLIPVSAVGHAAILAAIKKYLPSLIPSPYSSERLDVIKQLKRTKKMDIQSLSNLKVSSSVLEE